MRRVVDAALVLLLTQVRPPPPDVGQPHKTMRVDIGLAIAQPLPLAIELRPLTYIPDCSSLMGLVCEQ